MWPLREKATSKFASLKRLRAWRNRKRKFDGLETVKSEAEIQRPKKRLTEAASSPLSSE